jgi:hypothetical protein
LETPSLRASWAAVVHRPHVRVTLPGQLGVQLVDEHAEAVQQQQRQLEAGRVSRLRQPGQPQARRISRR